MSSLSSVLGNKIEKAVEESFKEQVGFLTELVHTPSVNPGSDAKCHSQVETEVAKVIRGKLRDLGVVSNYLRLRRGRPNLVAWTGPVRTRKSLLWVGNMDTGEKLETQSSSLDGEVYNNHLYGTGVLDMKSSLSVYLFALQALKNAGINLDGKLKLAFTADGKAERPSRLGLNFLLNKGLKAKSAIIAKPSTEKIAIGHRGGYRFVLRTFGESVNTGRKSWERGKKGKNAITDMVRVTYALAPFELPYKMARAFPGRQPVFTFPVRIAGGGAIDQVPAFCQAWGDVRLMPGNTDVQVKMWMQERLATLSGVKCEVEDILFVPAVEIDRHEPVVQSLAGQAKSILGKEPRLEGCGPWNDAWMLVTRDIPCIAGFGPNGGEDTDGEWVDLESLKQVTMIYARTAADYLGVL